MKSLIALALSTALSLSTMNLAHAQEEIPASNLNVARYWHALSDQSPDFEAIAKSTGQYRGANQFDQPEVYERILKQTSDAFTTGFAGNELLVVNLGVDVSNYDFERYGFELSAFNGQTFIPTSSPSFDIGRERVQLDRKKYRIVFDNPEPFAFMDLQPDVARAFLAGRNSKRVTLAITLQPVGAQTDQVSTGYSSEENRTVIARIVNAKIIDGNEVVWERAAEAMDASQIAEAAAKAGSVVEVSEKNVKAIWHRLRGTTPDFVLEASKTSAFRSANRFDQEAVLEAEIAKAAQRFADFIPNAKLLKGAIGTKLSEYDANKSGFNVSLFSGASYLEGGVYFQNAEEFAFVPMTPAEADAFIDKHGRIPNVRVDFEAQPIVARSHLQNFASLTPEREVQSYLTKVLVTAETSGQRTTLIDETRPPLGDDDLAQVRGLPITIDTASVYDDADIVMTWAKATGQTPNFDEWAQGSSDYRSADNEFVRKRLFPTLVQQRKDFLTNYDIQPWRVRIAARLSEYDFDNNRFELRNIDFDRNLIYRDSMSKDVFGDVDNSRQRMYELRLTNIGDLQYFSLSPDAAEEVLTQMGSGRAVTLDMLVYPTKAVRDAQWGEQEKRLVEAVITDVRLQGKSSRYGGQISQLFELRLAEPPADIVTEVSVQAKPHVDPMAADVKDFKLGMSKKDFERQAKREFGKVEPYRGNANVLRFESADRESGYGHFDASGKLVFLQYYRTLAGMGKTDAVVKSVIDKYGTPFARDGQSIGSKIKYTYLYFSDPTELGRDAKEQKVGLWVEVQESDQLRPITQLEINLGEKPE